MAKNNEASEFFNSREFQKAHEEHKDKIPEPDSFGVLPEGIERGKAQLKECEITKMKNGEYAGKYLFRATGIVVSPVEHKGEKIAGLRTQVMIGLHDNPRSKKYPTTSDNIRRMYDELKKLGLDLSSLSSKQVAAGMEALVKQQPFFAFRTFKSKPTPEYPDPKTQQVWLGKIDYTPEEDEELSDNSAPGSDPEDEYEPLEDADQFDGEPEKPARPAAAAAQKTRPKPKASGPDTSGLEDVPLEQLAQDAYDDPDAEAELIRRAKEAGVSQVDIEEAEDWEEVVVLIRESGEEGADESEVGEEPEGEEAEPEIVPELGQTFNYRPISPKTNKPSKKAVSCEVKTVNKRKKTCRLVSLEEEGRYYSDVPWDQLIPE